MAREAIYLGIQKDHVSVFDRTIVIGSINLSLYLHQISAGPNHNQEQIVSSSFANGFGTTGVNDWPLLDAPQPNANIIARAKGLHIQANQEGHGWFSPFSMVFQEQDSR